MNYGHAALSVASCSERADCVRSASFMLSSIRCCKALHSCLSLANSSALLHLRAMIPCKAGISLSSLAIFCRCSSIMAGQLGRGRACGYREDSTKPEAMLPICHNGISVRLRPREERVAVECTAHVILAVHRQVNPAYVLSYRLPRCGRSWKCGAAPVRSLPPWLVRGSTAGSSGLRCKR